VIIFGLLRGIHCFLFIADFYFTYLWFGLLHLREPNYPTGSVLGRFMVHWRLNSLSHE
jgi:hypothetical protein